jgi:hypothetical protein
MAGRLLLDALHKSELKSAVVDVLLLKRLAPLPVPLRAPGPQVWEGEPMPRRGSSARAAALRRAQQAKAARDAERLRREQEIEAALTDYFEATEQASRIRAEARRKADQLLADAERAAHAPGQAAAAAVRRLRDLVGAAAEVAALCGITASAVRAMLAEPSPGPSPDAAAIPPAGPVAVPAPPVAYGTAEPDAEQAIQERDLPSDGHQPRAAASEASEWRG